MNWFELVVQTMTQADAEDAFDAKHGTATWSAADAADPMGNWDHFPAPPRFFDAVMKGIAVRHEDFTFVDLGSGKGRSLLMASEHPFRRCHGIELDPKLVDVARENLLAYRSPTQRCADITIEQGDMLTWTPPAEDTVFWLYNPFGPRGVQQITELTASLRRSLETAPRRIVLAFLMPFNAQVFDASGFLHRWGPQGLEALPPPGNVEPFKQGRYAWALYASFGA